MTEDIEICVNRASGAELCEHLRTCDAAFVPPLSGRVIIEEYAAKIASAATRVEAWAGQVLAGLVAVYLNDQRKHVAFITSVSVREGYLRQGVAARLLEECIALAIARGFAAVELDVDATNEAALALYEKLGFARSADGDQGLRLRLRLPQDARRGQ